MIYKVIKLIRSVQEVHTDALISIYLCGMIDAIILVMLAIFFIK